MEKQNSETEDDFLIMQQEAIRRVREMQSRARATLENAGMHIESREPPDSLHNNVPHNDATHSNTSHVDAPYSNASHSDTSHKDVPHKDVPHSGSAHSNASHSDPPHASTSNFGASPFSSQHENQRPTEKHSPHREEPPVIHAPGLNIDIESDQLMLLVTLYLLIKDGADKWLILALAYVMLT